MGGLGPLGILLERSELLLGVGQVGGGEEAAAQLVDHARLGLAVVVVGEQHAGDVGGIYGVLGLVVYEGLGLVVLHPAAVHEDVAIGQAELLRRGNRQHELAGSGLPDRLQLLGELLTGGLRLAVVLGIEGRALVEISCCICVCAASASS